jgi:hypothetical protein
MQIIDTVLAQITEHQGAGSSAFLAQALASACSRHYSVSLLDASVKLDRNSMDLFCRLAAISKEPDFSNAAQDKALRHLRDMGLIDIDEYNEHLDILDGDNE